MILQKIFQIKLTLFLFHRQTDMSVSFFGQITPSVYVDCFSVRCHTLVPYQYLSDRSVVHCGGQNPKVPLPKKQARLIIGVYFFDRPFQETTVTSSFFNQFTLP